MRSNISNNISESESLQLFIIFFIFDRNSSLAFYSVNRKISIYDFCQGNGHLKLSTDNIFNDKYVVCQGNGT
jgi:hypothetical protein